MCKQVAQRWKAKGEPVLILTQPWAVTRGNGWKDEAWTKKVRLVDVSPERAQNYSWFYDIGKEQGFSNDFEALVDLERRHCILYLLLDIGLSLLNASLVYRLIFQEQAGPVRLCKIYLKEMWRRNIPINPRLDPKESSSFIIIREAESRRVLLCDIASQEALLYPWVDYIHKNMISNPRDYRQRACNRMTRMQGPQKIELIRKLIASPGGYLT